MSDRAFLLYTYRLERAVMGWWLCAAGGGTRVRPPRHSGACVPPLATYPRGDTASALWFFAIFLFSPGLCLDSSRIALP
jgi:hypothetical protein